MMSVFGATLIVGGIYYYYKQIKAQHPTPLPIEEPTTAAEVELMTEPRAVQVVPPSATPSGV